MKKLTTVTLSLFMILGLAACGNPAGSREQTTAQTTTAESTTGSSISEAVNDASADSRISADSGSETEVFGEPSETSGEETEAEISGGEGGKVLVAYFSATNTTEGVANRIAEGLGVDLYEIIPEDPYTDEDLNYNDSSSRTTIEMNDPDARPAISGAVENMEQYSVIFLGYPIWWGEAAKIMDTFVESYDFTDKTIVPFCTSGGSGVGSSAKNLEQLATGGQWLAGTRFNGSESQDALMEWVNGLGLDLES